MPWYRSSTDSGVIMLTSLTPFLVETIFTWSVASWYMSLSPVKSSIS